MTQIIRLLLYPGLTEICNSFHQKNSITKMGTANLAFQGAQFVATGTTIFFKQYMRLGMRKTYLPLSLTNSAR